ncbi:nitroreductase family protein [Veillonella agrestimuris]|uniref:nitroreductase family protein n=1 Tax=Veillonella agrestimuris TaxID=2941340 RepID=UPI00204209E1|nr:nitroreductase family protein [Veillonella agrestimuris]
MDIMSLLLQRRSVRKYSDKEVTKEILEQVVAAGLLAPTSKNRRPWQFHVVQNRDALVQLSQAKASGATFLAEAPAAIVVTGDETVSDVWVEDVSIAMSFIMLQAESLGLGSCWVQMHLRSDANGVDAEDNVRRMLGVSSEQRIVGVLGVGYNAFAMKPKTMNDVDMSRVHWID